MVFQRMSCGVAIIRLCILMISLSARPSKIGSKSFPNKAEISDCSNLRVISQIIGSFMSLLCQSSGFCAPRGLSNVASNSRKKQSSASIKLVLPELFRPISMTRFSNSPSFSGNASCLMLLNPCRKTF